MQSTINNGMCRCCASEGTFKNFSTTYHWMGDEEIYADMLKECFDISLSSADPGEEGGICEVCITQLRNAFNFKKQVLHTEQQFKKRLQDNLFKADIVKVEATSLDEANDSDNDNDISEDYSGPEYEVPIKTETAEEAKPKKRAAKATTSKAKKAKTDDGEPSTKRTDGDAPKRRKRKKNSEESATPERVEHRVNLTAILQYSNASPFRDKTIRGFSCLYCAKSFQHIDDLRAHTAQQSEKDKLNTMIDYKLSYNPIKVDITDLRCTVCDVKMKDLNDLKDHLINVHNKTIHKHIKDIILPFRLENGQNFTCVICSVVHISFKNLYHHMSSHYRNYCCNKCGVGYITIAALRKHDKTHAQGIFPCDFCDKSYTSLTKKRNHEKGVHTGGWLRNKCPHCPEIFVSYYDRSEHLVKAHNEKPIIYPCNACNKTYKKKFELNRHIKHHHLQQRSYLCDKCNAKFFSKRGLVDHLAKHAGGEVYACDVCGKVFSRARTLREHLKLHEDEKRYQCEICKKTFMQKCSLKSHVRLHQDDLDIFKEFDDVKHLIDNREMTLKEIAAESKKKAEADKRRSQECVVIFAIFNSDVSMFAANTGKKGAKNRKRTVKQEGETEKLDKLVYREKHVPEMKKQWHNLTTLLKYSNATPFKDRNDAGYICAYCFKTFPDANILRTHTQNDHIREKPTYKAGSGLASFVVFLDIVDLKCTVCDQPMDTLNILTEHLVKEHDKKYYLGVTDYFQPFKLSNEQQINCCLCNDVFHNMKLLMQHMNNHYRNFICKICGAGFVNSFRLNRHETTHGKKKSSFPCRHCGQVFGAESKRKAHVNTEHKGIPGDSVCQICKARFKNYYQKTRHMMQVHNAEGIKCDMCEKKFNLKSNLMLHMRVLKVSELEKHRINIRMILQWSNATPIRCRGGIGYACSFCLDQYPNPADLKSHTLESHDDKAKLKFMKGKMMFSYLVKLDITQLKCKICEANFDSLEQLVDHLIYVHDKKMFTDIKNHIMSFKFDDEYLRCIICRNMFNKFKALQEHMNIHYRNYVCEVCDAGFVNRHILSNHMEAHKLGTFKCDHCPKIFDTRRKKKSHEKSVHFSNLLNKCGYCNEKFKDYRKKDDHIAKVHGVKPLLKCQACDKTFVNKTAFTIHTKRDHLMERRHKCSECDMKFFSSNELKDHSVKHTGERGFRCSICNKAYGRRKTLNEHMRIHINDRRFKCEHCGLTFVQKCSWKGHVRSKHGDIV
ncbi:LOW QUALITY PROTEIN: uncharacterized protein ACR2FA_008387 [Aphomia sociella]